MHGQILRLRVDLPQVLFLSQTLQLLLVENGVRNVVQLRRPVQAEDKPLTEAMVSAEVFGGIAD